MGKNLVVGPSGSRFQRQVAAARRIHVAGVPGGAQAASMIACDFFTVDTVFLRRLYVLFFHRA